MLGTQTTTQTEPALIVGTWSHLFDDDKGERLTRIVLDASNRKLIHIEVQANRAIPDSYRKPTRREFDDVVDSLVSANVELFDSPDDFGLQATKELPAWVAFKVSPCASGSFGG